VDADDVVLGRLKLLRNEVDYLKREANNVRSFQEYGENTRLRKAAVCGNCRMTRPILKMPERRPIRTGCVAFANMPRISSSLSSDIRMTNSEVLVGVEAQYEKDQAQCAFWSPAGPALSALIW
jgi:hypothetical protein